MTDAKLQSRYAKIVDATVLCQGVVDLISQECSVVGCKEGAVPLLPGLWETCRLGYEHTHLTISAEHVIDVPCPGYQAKPLSLETLLESLTSAAGWNPLVNVGRTLHPRQVGGRSGGGRGAEVRGNSA